MNAEAMGMDLTGELTSVLPVAGIGRSHVFSGPLRVAETLAESLDDQRLLSRGFARRLRHCDLPCGGMLHSIPAMKGWV